MEKQLCYRKLQSKNIRNLHRKKCGVNNTPIYRHTFGVVAPHIILVCLSHRASDVRFLIDICDSIQYIKRRIDYDR